MQTIERPKYVSARRGLEILREAGFTISTNRYYAGLNSGEVPSVKVGHKYHVREDLVAQMEAKT